MEISIREDIDFTFNNLENSLQQAEPHILGFKKQLIYEIVTTKYTNEFIKRQRRINALKSPFKKVREFLNEVIGENIEEVQIDEVIDLAPLDEEKNKTLEILINLSYKECLLFLNTTTKQGLKRANTTWRLRNIEK